MYRHTGVRITEKHRRRLGDFLLVISIERRRHTTQIWRA